MYWDEIRKQTINARHGHARTSTAVAKKPSVKPQIHPRPTQKTSTASTIISQIRNASFFNFSILKKVALVLVGSCLVLFAIFQLIPKTSSDIDMPFFSSEKSVPYLKSPDAAHLQFSQSGEPWSYLPYWNSNVSYEGCGLCSYTSAIDILTGVSYTPADMLEMRGDWAGMDAYTKDDTGTDGRSHAQWTQDTFGIREFQVQCSMEALKAAVSRGDCVAIICTRGPVFVDNTGDIADYDGHFVCVWALDEQGNFRVHDSALPHGYGTDVRYSEDEMSNMIDYTTSITVYQA